MKSQDISGKISIGGSKRISNRLLIIRSIADSNIDIDNISLSDDSQNLLDLLEKIRDGEKSNIPVILDIKNTGTAARFLTAYLTTIEGAWFITGKDRMRQRPMNGLVDALLELGANISYAEKTGFIPIKITGANLRGNEISIDVSQTSQFLSAIMMIGPYLEEGIRIRMQNKPVSMPYVEMTRILMQQFNASVNISSNIIDIKPSHYKFRRITVEPDWSSASYWYELIALSKDGKIELPGFSKDSIQGDSILAEVYENLGVTTTYTNDGIVIERNLEPKSMFSFDFSGSPDIVPSVLTTCAALEIKSEFKNISHLKHKESDRINALTIELRKIGAIITQSGNNLILKSGGKLSNKINFDTHNDHRMAMAFAPLALKFPEITIDNPYVVNKSYPEYWDEIIKLNFAFLKLTTD